MIRLLTLLLILFAHCSSAKAPKPEECSFIDELNIIDNGLLNAFNVLELKREFEGRCLYTSDLSKLIISLAHYAIEYGYITPNVWIEPKKTRVKTLNIHIKPGIVGESTFLKKGSNLNMRDAEQELDNINRLPGYNAKIRLSPGIHENESDTIMHIEKGTLLSASLSTHNHGTKSNGVNQGDVHLASNNALGIYESLTFHYNYGFNKSLTSKASQTATGGIEIPYGYNMLKLHISYFDYQRHIPGSYSDLNYTGSNYNYTADLERIVHRNSNSKTMLKGSLILKDSSNYIRGILLDTSSRKLSVVGLTASHSRSGHWGMLNTSFGVQRGLRSFGAQKDDSASALRAQFTKYTVDASYTKGVNLMEQIFIANSSLHIQASPDRLFDSEHVAIGGMQTVRGFRDVESSGETGWYFRNDISYKIPELSGTPIAGDVQCFAGLDYGKIKKNRSKSSAVHDVSGMSLGMRNISQPVSLTLAYERPLLYPHKHTSKDLVYFKLSISF